MEGDKEKRVEKEEGRIEAKLQKGRRDKKGRER